MNITLFCLVIIKTRSNHPEALCKKGFLNIPQNSRLQLRCFPVNFAKFLRTSFFCETPPFGIHQTKNLVIILVYTFKKKILVLGCLQQKS